MSPEERAKYDNEKKEYDRASPLLGKFFSESFTVKCAAILSATKDEEGASRELRKTLVTFFTDAQKAFGV